MALVKLLTKRRLVPYDSTTKRLVESAVSQPDSEGNVAVVMNDGTYRFEGANVRMDRTLVCRTQLWLSIRQGEQEWAHLTVCRKAVVSEVMDRQELATLFDRTDDLVTCLECLASL